MRRLLAVTALALLPFGAAAQAPLGTAVQDGLTNLPPPELTEVWAPVAKVTPGPTDAAPPSDAIVLNSLDAWQSVKGGPAPWKAEGGDIVLMPGTGDIQTKMEFGDAQIHLEWMPPVLGPEAKGQDRSNTGLYIQGRYEVQILDSFENVTYANGQAGSIYKQHVPLVNPARPAPAWQSYDIVYTAPRFDAGGKLVSPARMTVFFNGVLIQNNVELKGPTVFRGPPSYVAHGPGPLLLQDHKKHNVRFRNIWIRKLD